MLFRMTVASAVWLLAIACTASADPERFGAEYEPCSSKSSTADIVECVAELTEAWDVRLNAAYQSLVKGMPPKSREALRVAQRLWIKYRDANCAWYGSGEGTITAIEAAECVRSMTAARATELEE